MLASPATLPRAPAFAALILTAALWGSSGAIAKILGATFGPMTLAWLRWLILLLAAAPFAWRERSAIRLALRDHWELLLAMTFLGGVPQTAFIYAGLAETSAMHLGLLNSVVPVLILLMGWQIYGHHLHRGQVVGVLISATGVLAILSEGSVAALARLEIHRGDLIVLVGMALWAFYTLKLNQRPSGISLVSFMFVIACFGLPIVLPAMLLELGRNGLPSPSAGACAALVYMSVVPALLANVLFGFGVRRIGPAQAGVFIHTMPLFACLFAFLLAGEMLHLYHAAGFVLIAGGAWISCNRAVPVLSSAPAKTL